jgi:hypothetical protein
LTVPDKGPKVLPTSLVCFGARQRAFICGGEAAPFITMFEVIFHCPDSIRFSAAEAAITGNGQNTINPNLVIDDPSNNPFRMVLEPRCSPDSWGLDAGKEKPPAVSRRGFAWIAA